MILLNSFPFCFSGKSKRPFLYDQFILIGFDQVNPFKGKCSGTTIKYQVFRLR